MAALVDATTGAVVTSNVPLSDPCGMTSDNVVGAASDGLLLDSATLTSLGCAAHSSLTVPTTALPPVTGLGVNETDLTVIGRIVSRRATVWAPCVALMWFLTIREHRRRHNGE